MMEAKVLTQSQLDKMMEAMGWSGAGGNYRPPQPLFGRDVEGCSAAQWYPYKATVWAEQLGEKSAETCRSGEMQSPIDLPECTEEEKRIAITTSWGEQTVKLTNNGHTVQLTIQDAAPSTTALGSSYTLVQCHYHWGSEHTVGGEQAPMVTHCVHTKDGTERYGVVGLFFEVSGSMDNTFLAQFEDHLPTASDAEHRRLTETTDTMDITFNNMLDGIDVQTYWTYDGSLTTPPCSEVVDWFLFMTPAKMTSAQLAKFEAAIGWGDAGGNYRPPQEGITDRRNPSSSDLWRGAKLQQLALPHGIHMMPLHGHTTRVPSPVQSVPLARCRAQSTFPNALSGSIAPPSRSLGARSTSPL